MKKTLHLLKSLFVAATLISAGQVFGNSGGGNQKTASGNGYIYNFNNEGGGVSAHEAINCFAFFNVFAGTGISTSGMPNKSEDYLSITFDGTQTAYTTAANRFFDNSTCLSQTIDLSNPAHHVVKARVKTNQAVQVGIFVGFDNKNAWSTADGNGFALQSVVANTWTDVTFVVPTKTWNNISLDMTKAIGLNIGVRDLNDPDKAPTGSVNLLIDWIKVGEQPSAPVSSNNKLTTTGNGYEFNFDGSNTDNCAVGSGSMIPPNFFFGDARNGYSLSSTFNGNMSLTTDGTQSGGGAWQLTLHDNGNCSPVVADLSKPENRKIEMKIKSSVDVPEVLLIPVDNNYLVGGKTVQVKSLKANTWTTLVFDVSVMETSTQTLNASQIEFVWLSFRNAWDDNNGGANSSVAGTYEIDYIKIGDAVVGSTVGNGNNYPTKTNKGYVFNYANNGGGVSGHEAINCFSNLNAFNSTNILPSGMANATDDYLSVNFDGTQSAYTTLSNRFFDNSTCATSTIDLSSPADRNLRAKVKINQAVQLGLFTAFEYKANWALADGSGFALVNVPADQWTIVDFKIPSADWQNNDFDMTKAIGLSIGVRDLNDATLAPTGAVNVLIDWIQIGDGITVITASEQIETKENITISPNPNNGDFNINGTFTSVKIYDMSGELQSELIYNGVDNVYSTNLPSGLYVAQIYQNDQIIDIQKIVITK